MIRYMLGISISKETQTRATGNVIDNCQPIHMLSSWYVCQSIHAWSSCDTHAPSSYSCGHDPWLYNDNNYGVLLSNALVCILRIAYHYCVWSYLVATSCGMCSYTRMWLFWHKGQTVYTDLYSIITGPRLYNNNSMYTPPSCYRYLSMLAMWSYC